MRSLLILILFSPLALCAQLENVSLRLVSQSQPIDGLLFENAGRVATMKIPNRAPTEVFSYTGGSTISFYIREWNEAGERVPVILARAEIPAHAKEALLVFAPVMASGEEHEGTDEAPELSRIRYKVSVFAADTMRPEPGHALVINSTSAELELKLDEQAHVLEANAVETFPAQLREGASSMIVELREAGQKRKLYATRWALKPELSSIVLIHTDVDSRTGYSLIRFRQ